MSKYRFLTFDDRKKIEKWHSDGVRPFEIAARLNVHTATIYNELNRGYTGKEDEMFRPEYSAEKAQKAIQESFKRRGHIFLFFCISGRGFSAENKQYASGYN